VVPVIHLHAQRGRKARIAGGHEDLCGRRAKIAAIDRPVIGAVGISTNSRFD
jgi:hypothetical protein